MVFTRQRIGRALRDMGLLGTAEKLRYATTVALLHGENRKFIAQNPGFSLPPKALAFDAYSAPDWTFYKKSGMETALYLSKLVKTYLPVANALKVLEWGCGPARVIRNLPAVLGRDDKVYGSDYNEATIAWCKANIADVEFVLNGLLPNPPLPFEDDFFDFVYSISVFTHLSESTCERWIAELRRVIGPGGILVITTNGDSLKSKMLPDELHCYETTGVAFRDRFQEGKKMFSACHSPTYLRAVLFKGFEVLEHAPASFPFTTQDCWVLRKES